MDRDQLIDLTRRALKLARDKTTDLAASEYTVAAADYTSAERHGRDRAMLLESPQLVGYASELPAPRTYCTKTVMGRSVLMTRGSDGSVKAFDKRVSASPVADRVGMRLRPAALLPLPRLDIRPRRQPRRRTRQGGISRIRFAFSAFDAPSGHRVRRVPVDRPRSAGSARRRRASRSAGRRTRVVGYRALVAARREGTRLPDQLEARNRHLRRELPLRDRAPDHVREDRTKQLHGVRLVRGRTTDLCSRSTESATWRVCRKNSGIRCRTWS